MPCTVRNKNLPSQIGTFDAGPPLGARYRICPCNVLPTLATPAWVYHCIIRSPERTSVPSPIRRGVYVDCAAGSPRAGSSFGGAACGRDFGGGDAWLVNLEAIRLGRALGPPVDIWLGDVPGGEGGRRDAHVNQGPPLLCGRYNQVERFLMMTL